MGLNRAVPTDEIMEQIVDAVVESKSNSISKQELLDLLGRYVYKARLSAGLEMAKRRGILIPERHHGEWRWYLTPENATMAVRVPEEWRIIGAHNKTSEHVPRMYIMRMIKADVLYHYATEMYPKRNELYFTNINEFGYVVRNHTKPTRYYRQRVDRPRVVSGKWGDAQMYKGSRK